MSLDNEVLIKVEGVSKRFCRDLKSSLLYGVQDIASDLAGINRSEKGLRKNEFWANKDISFELRRGECLGLIGHNGAGKTTLLKMLNGLIKPDQGTIEIKGRVGALIALGAGFNPVLTGRENVYVAGAVLGLTKKEIETQYDEIVEFAELAEFMDAPVQSYSSGMQVRLGFAVATAMKPDVLLIDEVLAVGDAAFRAKCFQRLGEIMESTAVVFVSHQEAQIMRLCGTVCYLHQGTQKFSGETQEGLLLYKEKSLSGINSPRSHTIVSSKVKSFSFSAIVSEESKTLFCNVNTLMHSAVNTGLCLIHIARNGDYIIHYEIDLKEKIVAAKESVCKFSLDVRKFVSGVYTVSFTLFEEGNKKTILHLLDYQEIEIKGDLGYGPFLYDKIKTNFTSL